MLMLPTLPAWLARTTPSTDKVMPVDVLVHTIRCQRPSLTLGPPVTWLTFAMVPLNPQLARPLLDRNSTL